MLRERGLSSDEIKEIARLEWLRSGNDWYKVLLTELHDAARREHEAQAPLDQAESSCLSLLLLNDAIRKSPPPGGSGSSEIAQV